MLSANHSSYVQHQVGRVAKGRTAETRMDITSVQPPYLVLPFQTRTHRGAGGRTRTRAGISIYVRQGKEVGQIKGWRGFQPSYLSSNLISTIDGHKPGKEQAMILNSESDVTTITDDDLPGLRQDMQGHADNADLSDLFRDTCRMVISAIDRVNDDVATHAALKNSLDEYVLVGNRELLLHDESRAVSC